VEVHDVVAAIMRQGDRVLLCHRAPGRRWYPDVWDFPGGHVEPREAPVEALRRELLEELGVDIGLGPLRAIQRTVHPDTGLVLRIFLVTSWTGAVENRQPEEHDQMGWFSVDELSTLTLAEDSYVSLLQELL
jgi:8-oxo-dGTP diphosphatase